MKKMSEDNFYITLGGPVQTMLTGTIGFLLLLTQRLKIRKTNTINFFQWILVFLSLFWLRQPANLVTWIAGYLYSGASSINGDEIILALKLGLPNGIILILTAMIGTGILAIIIFRIIPRNKRLSFIAAGIFGGILGYSIWLKWLGPVLMP